jgi:hypothetical protein
MPAITVNRRRAPGLLGGGALAPAYSARAMRLVEPSIVVDLLNQFQFQDFSVTPPTIEQWLRTPGTFSKDDAYEEGLRFFAESNGFLDGYSERTEALVRRGYSDGNITGILGGTAIRVLGAIWR